MMTILLTLKSFYRISYSTFEDNVFYGAVESSFRTLRL